MRLVQWIAVGLFLIVTAQLEAQVSKQVTTQELLWLRYYAQVTLNDNWRVRTEVEERSYIVPWRQHQILFRNHLERKLKNGWSTALGFTWFEQTLPHEPTDTDVYTRLELRPQQELLFKQKISNRLSLTHRYWFEERFFQKLDGRNPTSQYEFGVLRFRYLLQGSFIILPAESLKGKMTLKVFDEIMLNIGNQVVYNTFDQNRIGLALQYGVTDNFALEGSFLTGFSSGRMESTTSTAISGD